MKIYPRFWEVGHFYSHCKTFDPLGAIVIPIKIYQKSEFDDAMVGDAWCLDRGKWKFYASGQWTTPRYEVFNIPLPNPIPQEVLTAISCPELPECPLFKYAK